MDNDLKEHMAECLKCQASKKAKFEKTLELQPLPQCLLPNQCIELGPGNKAKLFVHKMSFNKRTVNHLAKPDPIP